MGRWKLVPLMITSDHQGTLQFFLKWWTITLNPIKKLFKVSILISLKNEINKCTNGGLCQFPGGGIFWAPPSPWKKVPSHWILNYFKFMSFMGGEKNWLDFYLFFQMGGYSFRFTSRGGTSPQFSRGAYPRFSRLGERPPITAAPACTLPTYLTCKTTYIRQHLIVF